MGDEKTSLRHLEDQQMFAGAVLRKGAKSSKDNYRPVSILPNTLKIYEKTMFKQMFVAATHKWRSWWESKKLATVLPQNIKVIFFCFVVVVFLTVNWHFSHT